LIGPGLVNLDFSVFKNNYIRKISENFNIQFPVGNIQYSDRANFAVPSSAAIFDAAGVDVSANDIITLDPDAVATDASALKGDFLESVLSLLIRLTSRCDGFAGSKLASIARATISM